MKKIANLAGHGKGFLYNRGSLIGNEGDNNFATAKNISKYFNDHFQVDSQVDREVFGNYEIPLDKRGEWASGFDIMMDHHTNAAGPKATGVLIILSYQSLRYYDVAIRLAKVIAETLGTNNRGVVFKDYNTGAFHSRSTATSTKKNWYGTLRNSKAPFSVLIEYVFHTNLTDLKKYLDKQDELAEAVCCFIANEFDIPRKITATIPKTSSQKDYLIKVTKRINLRKGPSTSFDIVRKLYSGVFTIVETKNNWGKLKSGLGWIWLGNVETVKMTQKSIADIAKEVVLGKWGNGSERKTKLESAGYDYYAVQKKVNEIL